MAIQFHPDVVFARLQQIASTWKVKSLRHNSPDEKTAPTVTGQYALMEYYNLHGIMQTSKDGSGTLLDTFLETQKVIHEQSLLLRSVFTGALRLGDDKTAAAEGIPEYWNMEDTAGRIFAIALMG